MQNVCVFCGSATGSDPRFTEAATACGREIARRGLGLVYGGASVGLMGVVANAVLAAGGAVVGVIPHVLERRELTHPGLTETIVVESMHQRKATMAARSDGFIALPGSIGTLEETFEILTWTQLGLSAKPCGFLNVAGYYDQLLAFLDHVAASGFLKPAWRAAILDGNDPGALLDRFAGWQPPAASKWLTDVKQT